MTETAALIIKVDSSGAARATGHLKDLERAAGSTERSANKLGKAWGTAIGLIGSAAVAGAVTNYVKLADTYALMTARLGMVTKGSEGLRQAQGDLFKLAQESRSSLEGVTDLYTKLANSSENLRGNHEKLLGVTTNVSKALTLSGADAASATAVIRQFSQAMASGALRGDEFVSVMEGAPRLARAIADGLNVPIGALRKMAAEGKLTADTVIRALESQGQVIDREFRNMPLTVGGAVQQVQTSLLQLVGDTNEATGASKGLAESISKLADVLASDDTKQGFATIVNGVTTIVTAMANALPAIAEFGNKLGGSLFLADRYIETVQKLGYERIQHTKELIRTGRFSGPTEAGARHNDILAQWERDKRMVMGDITGANDRTASALANIKGGLPYLNGGRGSVVAQPGGGMWMMLPGASAEVASGGSSFKPTATGVGGGGGGRRAQAAATREVTQAEKDYLDLMKEVAAHDEYVDDVQREYTNEKLRRAEQEREAVERGRAATDELIRDMEFEISLIGKSNVEREKMTALRYADANATDEQRAQIAKLAEDMVRAREAEQVVNDIKSATQDFATEAVLNWKNAGDAASAYVDRLKRLAVQMLAEKAIRWLFGIFMGGQTDAAGNTSAGLQDGFWGGVANGGAFDGSGVAKFANGGTFTNGFYNKPTFFQFGNGGQFGVMGEAGPEAVMPLARGADGKLGVRSSGGSKGGDMTMQVVINNHAGAKINQRQETAPGPDGSMLRRMVIDIVAESMNGGQLGAVTKNRFGLRDTV